MPDTSSRQDGNAAVTAELIATLDGIVQADPKHAVQVATQGVRDAATGEERAAYRWALARAQHELGDVQAALESYRTAGKEAQRAGAREVLGRIRISQSLAQAEVGDTSGALRTLTRAAQLVPSDGVQRVMNQRCLVLMHAGRLRDALASADEALRLAVEHDDVLTQARAGNNRGVIHLQMGDLAAAAADMERARDVATETGQDLMVCMMNHDLALVFARQGEIPRALRAFSSAVEGLERLGAPARTLANLERDRAECLLLAGLADEAATAAARAEDLALSFGNAATAAEGALLGAVAHIRNDEPEEALRCAERADEAFASARRPGWRVYANFVAVEARLANPEHIPLTDDDRTSARRLVRELRRHGWDTESDQTLVMAALLELADGNVVAARRLLDDAADARENGALRHRLRAWQAEALLALATGDREAAREAIEAGMRVIDEHVTALAAIDMRASVAAQGAELTALGLGLAVEDGDPTAAFRWADRWRAGTLQLAALRANADDRIAAKLSELRQTETSLWTAEPGTPEFSGLRRQAAALQAALTDQSRGLSGDAPMRPSTDVDAVTAALGPRSLVEYAIAGDDVVAIVLSSSGPPRLVPLGPTAAVGREVEFATAAMQRLARTRREGVVAEAEAAMGSVDDLLIAPLELDDGPLVVVPVQGLHDVAWNGLPSLRGRAITVSPSAAAWLSGTLDEARVDGIHAERVGLIAGPGLPGADREVTDLAASWGAAGLTGDDATVDACLELAARVDLLHVAAHGRFYRANAALTSLALADGALTVYDLVRLPAVPRVFVLSACGIGRSARVGDEVVGFAHAVLGLGARAVIAPILAVPDEATARLMDHVHACLREGVSPADALAAAHARIDASDPSDVLAAWSFSCLGTG